MREVVVRTGEGKHRQAIEVGPHRLVADEPAEHGGSDAGPEPHELLAAALGSCMSMTARMYAERKGWAVSSAEVRVSVSREQERTRFTCRMRLEGSLDEAQRRRCLEIADRCPVHRTLAGEIDIVSTLE